MKRNTFGTLCTIAVTALAATLLTPRAAAKTTVRTQFLAPAQYATDADSAWAHRVYPAAFDDSDYGKYSAGITYAKRDYEAWGTDVPGHSYALTVNGTLYYCSRYFYHDGFQSESILSTYTRSVEKGSRRYLFPLSAMGDGIQTWDDVRGFSSNAAIDDCMAQTDYVSTGAAYVQLARDDYRYTFAFKPAKDHSGSGFTRIVYGQDSCQVTMPDATGTFTCEGCEFSGWATSLGGTAAYQPGVTYELSDDATLYAVMTPHTYTIAFAPNGATGTQAELSVKYHADCTLPTCSYTCEGYQFAGWLYNGTTYQAGDKVKNLTTTDGATVTFTAQWKKTVIVEFEPNGATGTQSESGTEVSSDTPYTLPRCRFTPPENCTFAGWEFETDGVVYQAGDKVDLSTVEGDYAIFDATWNQKAMIEFDANGGSGTMASVEVPSTGKYTLPACAFTAPSGKEFAGWNYDGDIYQPGAKLTGLSTESGEVVLISAVWSKLVTITFDANGGQLDAESAQYSGQGSIATRDYRSGVAFGELPSAGGNDGYTFAGWWTKPSMEDATAAQVTIYSTVPDYSVKYYARWKQTESAKITVYLDANGGTVAASQAEATLGNTFRDLPTPQATDTRSTYTFVGWYTEKIGGGNIVNASTDVTSDYAGKTLYARWTCSDIKTFVNDDRLAFERVDGITDSANVIGTNGWKVTGGILKSTKSSFLRMQLPSAAGTIKFVIGGMVSVKAGDAESFMTYSSSFDLSVTEAIQKVLLSSADCTISNITFTASGSTSSSGSTSTKSWTSEGGYYRSPSLSHGESSVCGYVSGSYTGPCEVKVLCKTSCEPGYYEEDGKTYTKCDRLELLCGDNVIGVADGINESEYHVLVATNYTSGANTYTVRYVKDSNANIGKDCVWVSSISCEEIEVSEDDPVTVYIYGNTVVCEYDGKKHTAKGYTWAASNPNYTASDFKGPSTKSVSLTKVGEITAGLSADDFTNKSTKYTDVTFVVVNDISVTITEKGGGGEEEEEEEETAAYVTIDGMSPAAWGEREIGVGTAIEWAVEATDGAKLTFSKLPTGLKYNSKTGLVAGTPTKAAAKAYQTTVKAKVGKVTTTFVFPILVNALPSGMVGTYYGMASAVDPDLAPGQFTLKVTAAGKTSGSFTLSGKKTSFKGTALEQVEDGYLAHVSYTYNKVKYTDESIYLTTTNEVNGVELWLAPAMEGGSEVLDMVEARRDSVKDVLKKLTKPVVGTHAVEDEDFAEGEYLNAKVTSAGAVTFSGKLLKEDGKLLSVSSSTRLAVIDDHTLGGWITIYKNVSKQSPVVYTRWWTIEYEE